MLQVVYVTPFSHQSSGYFKAYVGYIAENNDSELLQEN